MPELQVKLDQLNVDGELYEKLESGSVACYACAHTCRIAEGRRGFCKVRHNENGVLRVPWGYVAGLQADPIQKKPFTHFLPGATALTYGMLGCNLHCDFCQNWLTSQAMRDPASDMSGEYINAVSPEQIVAAAKRNRAIVLASSYNEPLITSEWSHAIFNLAKAQGLRTVYVSNGYATPDVLEYMRPVLDGMKIDLKTMQAAQYRALGGDLRVVLDTIDKARQLGLWVEVVTLVIPGFNDSTEELWDTARAVTAVSADIPWHVTAYHPDYHMESVPTPASTLQRAAEIGQEAGLHYVYAGNLPGRVGSLEDTHCPHCQTTLIRRRGYIILGYSITSEGKCPSCGTAIAGVWGEKPSGYPHIAA